MVPVVKVCDWFGIKTWMWMIFFFVQKFIHMIFAFAVYKLSGQLIKIFCSFTFRHLGFRWLFSFEWKSYWFSNGHTLSVCNELIELQWKFFFFFALQQTKKQRSAHRWSTLNRIGNGFQIIIGDCSICHNPYSMCFIPMFILHPESISFSFFSTMNLSHYS